MSPDERRKSHYRCGAGNLRSTISPCQYKCATVRLPDCNIASGHVNREFGWIQKVQCTKQRDHSHNGSQLVFVNIYQLTPGSNYLQRNSLE